MLRLDGYLLQRVSVWRQLNVKDGGSVLAYEERTRLIAHGTEGERPAIVTGNGIFALEVGGHRDAVLLVDDAGKGDGLACAGIEDDATKLLCPQREHSKE